MMKAHEALERGVPAKATVVAITGEESFLREQVADLVKSRLPDDVEITVVDIRGDKVRLGITAPTQIAVHRKEVYDAIKRENEQAACFKRDDLGPLGSGAAPKSVRPGRTARASSLASQAGSGGTDKATSSNGVHPKRVEVSSASSHDSAPTRTTA